MSKSELKQQRVDHSAQSMGQSIARILRIDAPLHYRALLTLPSYLLTTYLQYLIDPHDSLSDALASIEAPLTDVAGPNALPITLRIMVSQAILQIVLHQAQRQNPNAIFTRIPFLSMPTPTKQSGTSTISKHLIAYTPAVSTDNPTGAHTTFSPEANLQAAETILQMRTMQRLKFYSIMLSSMLLIGGAFIFQQRRNKDAYTDAAANLSNENPLLYFYAYNATLPEDFLTDDLHDTMCQLCERLFNPKVDVQQADFINSRQDPNCLPPHFADDLGFAESICYDAEDNNNAFHDIPKSAFALVHSILTIVDKSVLACAVREFKRAEGTFVSFKKLDAFLMSALYGVSANLMYTFMMPSAENRGFPEKSANILQQDIVFELNQCMPALKGMNLTWRATNSTTIASLSFQLNITVSDEAHEIDVNMLMLFLKQALKTIKESASIKTADENSITIELFQSLTEKERKDFSNSIAEQIKIFQLNRQHLADNLKRASELSDKLIWMDFSHYNKNKKTIEHYIIATVSGMHDEFFKFAYACLQEMFGHDHVRNRPGCFEINVVAPAQTKPATELQKQTLANKKITNKTFLTSDSSTTQSTANTPATSTITHDNSSQGWFSWTKKFTPSRFWTTKEPDTVQAPQANYSDQITAPAGATVVKIINRQQTHSNQQLYAYIVPGSDARANAYFSDNIRKFDCVVAPTGHQGIVQEEQGLYKIKTIHNEQSEKRLWGFVSDFYINADTTVQVIRFCHLQLTHSQATRRTAIQAVLRAKQDYQAQAESAATASASH